MPKPIKHTYAEVVSELQTHVRRWRHVHPLDDKQVVAILALISAEYAQSAYVLMSREDAASER
jgi:hypothetical protein